jgi:hypothetical protein
LTIDAALSPTRTRSSVDDSRSEDAVRVLGEAQLRVVEAWLLTALVRSALRMRQPPASTTALRSTNVQSKPTDAVTLWVIERLPLPVKIRLCAI